MHKKGILKCLSVAVVSGMLIAAAMPTTVYAVACQHTIRVKEIQRGTPCDPSPDHHTVPYDEVYVCIQCGDELVTYTYQEYESHDYEFNASTNEWVCECGDVIRTYSVSE